jgi:hypothetical protein
MACLVIALATLLMPAGARATTAVATLVQTIDTSQFSPPSPDPMGITYLASSDTLLMSDSEVNEIPALFTGDNLFEINYASGTLLGTSTTILFSDEPTGLAFNPVDGHVFVSHDNGGGFVFEVDPGVDGLHGTADDIVTSFSSGDFSSVDPEGIAFDSVQGFLYIADGLSSEVFQLDPGANGVFDGVAPTGDDQATSFDTEAFGLTDPEGITFDSDNGFLYLVGYPDDLVFHVTTTGTLVRTIDISAANAPDPAALAYAPGSLEPLVNGLYIADRGVDNNSDPDENDGLVFEFSVPQITPGNVPPTVDAGPDQPLELPGVATLDGTVLDETVPAGSLTILWSHVSGPGTVTFTDASAEDTTASFSFAGTYVLRLMADDGELSSSDDTTIVVTGDAGETVIEVPVAASSDDAEEREAGAIVLSSSDLELVFDNGGNQTVGMRFTGVAIPRDASITNAFVQFQADEANSVATSLTIRGEAVDDAATFVESSGNISSRPTTTASASWSPVPWTAVGEAGPDQRTSNIASVIEEIAARPGWSAGNALVLIITGTGERTAESFDGSAAPLLRVAYTASTNQPPTVSINTPPDASTLGEGLPVTFTGTLGSRWRARHRRQRRHVEPLGGPPHDHGHGDRQRRPRGLGTDRAHPHGQRRAGGGDHGAPRCQHSG